MTKHSHIQIPNTILRHFQDPMDPSKKVWFLDIATKSIFKKPSGRLGTATGYYSVFGENYWCTTVENPLGNLNKQVLAFCNGELETINITRNDMEVVKRYIRSAMVRSKLAFRSMKEAAKHAFVFTEQQMHDALSVIGMSIVDKAIPSLDLENMAATILVNKTTTNFVVPRNCFYGVIRDGCVNYVMPISPIGALLLLPHKQLSKTDGKYALIDDPEQINTLNKYALKFECVFNQEFVASSSRTELEFLQKILSGHI